MAQRDTIDLNLGFSFDHFMALGEEDERIAINRRITSLTLPDDLVPIKSAGGITLVSFASIWCPDCVVAVPIIELIRRADPNIKTVYFEREDEGMRDLAVSLSGVGSIPLIFAADTEGRVKSGFFIERPVKFRMIAEKAANEKDRAELISSYRAGDYDRMVFEEIAEILAAASR